MGKTWLTIKCAGFSSAMIGQSEKIETIIKTIRKIAPKELRVLILGEAGNEKPAVAAMIHEQSPRQALPLLSFPLTSRHTAGAIRQRLLGAGQGATTADLKKHPGLLEAARGGTLFIDHVEYLPAGPLESEARLIGGSSLADLAERAKPAFDLFAEVLLVLPPLRERLADLPLLLEYFLEKFNAANGKEIKGFDGEATELLANYNWPGNVAELSALIECLVIKAQADRLTAADLPLDLLIRSARPQGSEYFARFEKAYIERMRAAVGGDQDKLAALLGVKPSFLDQ
jgi:DNA-binding NtrC family response regulator